MEAALMLETIPEEGTDTPHETTQFIEETSGGSMGAISAPDVISRSDVMDKSGLGNFLSRPVRLLSLTWANSDASGRFGGIYYPWKQFFSNQYIQYKLNNYAFIRCNLKVKVVVNASPFYYGALKMVYSPMTCWGGEDDEGTASQILMKASQKPGVWIDPSRCEGAEMTLPFFYTKNFLSVGDADEFQDIGDLRFYCYAPLQSANGVASSNVTIQVYAWAENIELSGPTLNLAMQGDEYGNGVVSAPASAIASVARAAKNLPVIGKFAAATEIGASAVSKVAKLFGFTNTPVLSDTQPVRSSPFPQLASTEIGFPVEKLTVDSKNELSIDPTTCGIPAEDELAIPYLMGKESVLATAPWTTSDVPDTNIVTMRVTPYNFIKGTISYGTRVQMTPQAMVAHMFSHWRGDLIYTFKFVATPFHKGRIRISYDPLNADMQTATDVGSILQNTIVDLGVSREIEVKVPYQQAISWMRVDKDLAHTPFGVGNAGLSVYEGYDNGIITMKVLTRLSAPVSTAPVYVIVSVRGAENLEVANPTLLAENFTALPLQGLEGDGPNVTLGETSSTDPNLNRVNFGEKIVSLRPLLRRSNFIDTVGLGDATGTHMNHYRFTYTRKPPYFGFDTNGLSIANNFATGAVVPFSWSKTTPWHWVARCFVGQRGSFHWTFNVAAVGPVCDMRVVRMTESTNQGLLLTQSSAALATATSGFAFYRTMNTPSGVAATNPTVQPVVSVSLPNVTGLRFQSTKPSYITNPEALGVRYGDDSITENVRLNIVTGPGATTKNVAVSRYAAVGTDYNLYYFLCVPTWYAMTSYPNYPVT